MSSTQVQRHGRPRALTLGFAVLVAVAAASTLLTAAVLEVQAGAVAYIAGEGHWSKGQQEATSALYRYALEGRPEDLAHARRALQVPLGDLEARRALERRPLDLERVRRGFLAGKNAPEDVDRMIWMFRWFSEAPYFGAAVAIWRAADAPILRVARIAGELEALPADATLQRRALADELLRLDRQLRQLEQDFSATLADGSRWLRSVLHAVALAGFLLLAGIAGATLAASLRRIRVSERKYRALFEQAGIGMAELDADGRVLEANRALLAMGGWSPGQLLGESLDELLLPDSGEPAHGAGERRLPRADGSTLWVKFGHSTIRPGPGAPERGLALVEDVSEARRLAREIAHHASHDALTGLFNRRAILERLRSAIESARERGEPAVLCFVDLDQFKLVNDSCGHAAGDALLCQLGGRLLARLRPGDSLGRLGGDEFAVVLGDTPPENAAEAAQRLLDAIAGTPFTWEQRAFALTASIGVVNIDADTPDVTFVLKAADSACYLAKGAGRNGVRVYRSNDVEVAQRHSEIERVGEIREAIEQGRLRLHAQRIATLDPTCVESGQRIELLLRVLDRDGHLQAPAAFLRAAERYDQVEAVDREVLRLALAALAAAPAVALPQRCHVNISAQSLVRPGFREYVCAAVDGSGVAAERLCFEITETAAIANLVEAQRFIEAVRSRGAEVALDDFGAGLSSFGYLRSLPVDLIKIDGSFIRSLDHSDSDRALVTAIHALSSALGKRTVAECVETPAALVALRAIGVHFAQGFVLHRPEPLEAMLHAVDAVADRGRAPGGP